MDRETSRWTVGWIEGRNVYVLDRKKTDTESDHKFNDETYKALVQHELSHSFFQVVSGGKSKPKWLWEGVAVFTSGQNKFNKKPTSFSKFLEYYEHEGFEEYAESGFATESLIRKFGKEKLLELIKSLKSSNSKDGFEKSFVGIYGEVPTYDFFSRINR